MMNRPRYSVVSLRMAQETRDDLADYAARHRRTLSNAGNILLEEALKIAAERDSDLLDR